MSLLFFFIFMLLYVFGWTYAAMHYRKIKRLILEKVFQISNAGQFKRFILEGWESSPKRYAIRIWGIYDLCFGIPIFVGALYLAFWGGPYLADIINVTSTLERILFEVSSKNSH